MAWEQRGGRQCYYRAKRVNGRVVKTYMGTGAAGEAAAAEDQRAREQRCDNRRRRDEVQRELIPAELLIAELVALAMELTQSTLLAAGLHEHRGAWRRRRAKKS